MSNHLANLDPATPTVDVKKHLLRTFLLSMIIPALLLVFFKIAPRWLDHRLHESIESHIQSSARLTRTQKTQQLSEVRQMDFDAIANSADPAWKDVRANLEREGIVGQFRRLHAAFSASIALCALLLMGFGYVYILSRKAAHSREALIATYRSAWRVSVSVALTQLLLMVPLLTYGSFELTVLALDQYYPKLIILIVIGGICALWLSAKALLKKVPLEFHEDMARSVTPAEAPTLWAAVQDAAARLKATPPDHIILGMQFNFYVTEMAVLHSKGRAEGRTLYLSLPIMRQMKTDEITTIIGHELGHFIGDDTKLSREFYPMRFKAHSTFAAIATSGIVGWPSVKLLDFFTWSFGEVEQRVSREREFLADQISARLTSPATAAKALIKGHVLGEAFDHLLRQPEHVNAQSLFSNSWHNTIREKLWTDPTFWPELFKKNTPHPMDSHPDLQARLEALGQTVTVEQAKTISVEEGESAYESWLAGKDALFAEIFQQADQQLTRINQQCQVLDADVLSAEGKAMLNQHFPTVIWPVRQFAVWLLVGSCTLVFALLVSFLMAGIVKDNIGFVMLGGICAMSAFTAFVIWRRHRNATLTLTAEGIMHSSWSSPLSFEEIENTNVVNHNGSYTVTFRLKHKQTSRWPLAMIFWPRNSFDLKLSWYQGKQEQNLDTLHRYLTRRLG